MVDEFDIARLSISELEDFIQDCRLRIARCEAQIEPSAFQRRRTFKILRGTVLMAGGFFGATFDPITLFLILLGAWDWIDGFSEDAAAMNRQIALHREANDISEQLDAAQARLEQLRGTPQ